MTAADKKERRQARHEAEELLRPIIMRRMGLYSTTGTIKRALKEAVDQYFAANSEAMRQMAEEIIEGRTA